MNVILRAVTVNVLSIVTVAVVMKGVNKLLKDENPNNLVNKISNDLDELKEKVNKLIEEKKVVNG